MKLKLEEHENKTWIKYCDLSESKNNFSLTFQFIFDISKEISDELAELPGCIVGLLFDEESESIVGQFIALLSVLRLECVFYPLNETKSLVEQLDLVKCSLVLSGSSLNSESKLVAK